MKQVLFFVIGSVLILTAVGKLWQLLTDPFVDIRADYPPLVLWITAFLELGAVWLLTSRAVFSVKWTALIVLFSGFFCVSFTRWLVGNGSCGCVGSIQIAPWISALFSLTVLCSLGWAGWSRTPTHGPLVSFWGPVWSKETKSGISGFVGLVFLGLIFGLFSHWQVQRTMFNSGKNVQAASRVDIGNVEAGTVVQSKALLKNLSDQSVYVLGSRSSCFCVMDQKDQIEIPANRSAHIPIIIEPAESGYFYNRIVFFLDSPDQKTVSVDLSGFVYPSKQENSL